MKKVALIVAGGSGKRMNSNVPKQFEILQGKPVLIHTFQAFLTYNPNMNFVLVLPKIQFSHWETLCQKHNFNLKHELAAGGETRFHSVQNGLKLISDDSIVFIHDGVRPLVSSVTIENCYQTALQQGNALPVIPVAESVRKVENDQNMAVNRSKYFLVQTPQTFQAEKIKTAYKESKTINFTDDSSVLESAGEKIHLVEGNRENIKITYPQDLIIANALLKIRNQ
ncbi:2-C-methyl-D-erythritol 4-phosphate cytidylyltransferase [Maribellus maritimus]|uniref:2-C-methyl-D-erythritol 4-phosphate cytidylyltransferase n=1 Tax=Maribellus maritimus TaxID=2870838 RepID=UPI001EEA1A04|nr:2-C-methyl-D-erythritol 4-phosphate cytidylyltransferase [Maribellus maritimus]MCG6190915.1 2-C-methyl-D-erythritol 4-phosphate cytidylyltransferase [Maribellus maritimus]